MKDFEADQSLLDLSIVLDDSGSVSDCDANFVNDGVVFLYDNLPAFYNSKIVKFTSKIYNTHDWSTDGKSLSDSLMQDCTNRGSTAMWDGLNEGMYDFPETNTVKGLVLFSDGLDNSSSKSRSDILTMAKENNIPIHVVALGAANIISLLELAKDTGGGFVYSASGENLSEKFKTISKFILYSYIVEWDESSAISSVKISVPSESGSIASDTYTID